MIKDLSLLLLACTFSSTSGHVETQNSIPILKTLAQNFTQKSDPAVTYSINYSGKSPIKNIPLHYAKIRVKIFYNGNPKGITEIITDDCRNFTYDEYKDRKSIVMEVISIDDQHQYHARCYDSTPQKNKHDLEVTCVHSAG